jgi:hypothetical protein
VLAEQPSDHGQVLPPGQHVVYGRVLPGQPDHRPDLLGFAHDVAAEDLGVAGVRAEQRAQDADGGGFTRAVRSEQGEYGALGSGEADPVEHPGPAERLSQASHRDGGRAHDVSPGAVIVSSAGKIVSTIDYLGHQDNSRYIAKVTHVNRAW